MSTTPLMEAVYRRDAESVRLLVEAGAQLETGTGRPLLHEAAQAGMLWLIEHILAAGVSVDLRDEDGSTPLGDAAWGGRLAVVRWLLGAPRLFGHSMEGGDTPLHRAAKAGSMAAVEALLAAGFDPNFFTAFEGQVPPRSPLTDAFSAGHGDVARRLAEGGAVAAMPSKLRPSFQGAIVASEVGSCIDACAHPLVDCDDLETLAWFLARPETQRHALLLADAIERDDLERVRALLDGGVPANDKLGKFVPLDVAWALERRAIAELLVSRGATSKRKPPRPGPTAEKRLQDLRKGKIAPDTSLMSEAREKRSDALFEAILERADAGLLVQMLCTAAHGLPENRFPIAWLERILAKGADVNGAFSSASPEPALARACWPPHPEAVKRLLAHGADPRWRSQHGWTVVHSLVLEATPELVRRNPARLQAYARDAEEVIHRLLDAGMDPSVELDIALRRRPDVAAWFSSHPSVKPDLVLTQMGSPMHGAATLGDAALLRRLIARGGDPRARADSSGESPKVKRGQTPLHVLSTLSSDRLPFEALDVLLGAGAAVNALDDAGQTPLDVVSFRAIRARLRAAGAMSGREIAEAEALPEEGRS